MKLLILYTLIGAGFFVFGTYTAIVGQSSDPEFPKALLAIAGCAGFFLGLAFLQMLRLSTRG